MLLRKSILVLGLCALLPSVCFSGEIPTNRVSVSYLEGEAEYRKSGQEEWKALSKGVSLRPGDEISVSKRSRVELRFPDGSVTRFSGNTNFIIEEKDQQKDSGKGEIRVKLFLGKVWANILKALNLRSGFAVHTPTAVAGVRGTIMRVDLGEDRSTLIKVYEGSVDVKPPHEIPKPCAREEGPREISGPERVEGPHEVSLEKWKEIITLKTNEQLLVSRGGKIVKKGAFDPELDWQRNEWVRWNMERDRNLRKLR